MNRNNKKDLIKSLYERKNIERQEWYVLLTQLDEEEKDFLRLQAANLTLHHFGKGVFIRGLIEISSYCRNNCYYCGLRRNNIHAQRYRLSKDDILNCCATGAELGFNTFVLQGGEDAVQTDEWIIDLINEIRLRYPRKAITLSIGERSVDTYRAFRKSGVDRFLLRHETRNDEHYSLLHPSNMSASKRRECLYVLKKEGFQTGTGMMIGSPGQTTEHLIDDLQFLEELRPEMIGIGPFIPATGTPFAEEPQGSVDTTILLISLIRLRFPKALIPATTALATIHQSGRQQAILAGANVVMPNLSPDEIKNKYAIYDNKANDGNESAVNIKELEKELNSIGYYINYGRGDYENK